MKFAVIATSGSQFSVSTGDTILVNNLPQKAGEVVTFDQVLLLSDEGKTVIGTPTVSGCSVKGEVIAQVKGEKVRIAKYKAKSRYDRVRGFRHSYTSVKITEIQTKIAKA